MHFIRDDEHQLIELQIDGIHSDVRTSAIGLVPDYFKVKDFEDYKRKQRCFVI